MTKVSITYRATIERDIRIAVRSRKAEEQSFLRWAKKTNSKR